MSFDNIIPLPTIDLLHCTTQIIKGHVSGNDVAPGQLPELITAVHRALAELGKPETLPEPTRPEPSVPIRSSVTSEYIVCLECGMHAKMLKRHLTTEHGLAPVTYRERWELPHDYPMTAPSYSKHRSGLAKQIGLGRRRRRS